MNSLRLSDNFEFLLREYAFSLIKNNANISDSVTDWLLGDLSSHVPITEKDDDDDDALDNFIEGFEEFINSKEWNRDQQGSVAKTRTLNESMLKALKNAQELKMNKIIEVSQKLENLEEQQHLFEKRFEESLNASDAKLAVLEAKQSYLKAVAVKVLLHETPITLSAMKKLKDIITNEKCELSNKICELEDLKRQYDEVKDHPDYQQLVIQWKKLQQQKKALISLD